MRAQVQALRLQFLKLFIDPQCFIEPFLLGVKLGQALL